MSDINPINNSLLRYQQPSSAVQPVSIPDSLSALSSLTNSALQLPSSSQLDSLPPAPPELGLRLHHVSAIADGNPETHVDHSLTRSADTYDARHVLPAGYREEQYSWIASELPFQAAEEVNDQKRDASLMFLQKVATSIPHIAEQIYLATIEQQKKTVQAYLRGDSGISDEAAEHAWQYFIVESSEPKCRAFRHIITVSHRISAADKEALIQNLQRARFSNGAVLREFVSAARPEEAIKLPDLPADSVSEDTVEMLARFGVTMTELQQFRTHAVHTAFIREKLLDENWFDAESKLYALARGGAISLAESTSLHSIMTAFRSLSTELSRVISKDLKAHGPDKDNKYISNFCTTPHSNRVFRQLYYNYLHSMPRLELYKKIRSHHLALTDNMLTPPKKMGLLNYRNNQLQLKKILNNSDEKRSTCLINNMPIMPFVFDIQGERPESARGVVPYGDKGLSFSFFDNLISNPAISMQRLASIGLFSTLEMIKITNTGELPVEWMAPFSDATLARMFAHRAYDYEPASNKKNIFRYKLRAIQAIKTIGRHIIPNYDYSDLGKLLAWIKTQLGYNISDDDLAYCLFTYSEKHKLTLCAISAKIINAEHPGNNIHYPAEDIAQDFLDFCFDVTQSEANRTPSCTAKLHQQFNEDLSLSQVLRLVAQRLNVRMIQEDRLGNFQHWYDSEGNQHLQPPDTVQEAFLVRPDALIPLNQDGSQQVTIDREHSDNHSLLVALIDYRRETAWRRMVINQIERDEELFQLESEFLALASATADNNRKKTP